MTDTTTPNRVSNKGNTEILVIDDDAMLIRLIHEVLKKKGIGVTGATGGTEGLSFATEFQPRVIILDIRMPKIGGMELLPRLVSLSHQPAVIMLTGHGTIQLATRAMKLGAYDFLTKPIDFDLLNQTVREALQDQGNGMPSSAVSQIEPAQIVGSNPALLQSLALIDQVAESELPILISGETGTGKELFAQRLHQKSVRSRKRFLAINCGSIQESLLESELFGHEKGAFTGATAASVGIYEAASGGTLFLDEIAEMSSQVQTSLLRTVETGEIRPVGASRSRYSDVRIVAASTRPLVELVDEGEFREDLYFRLNGLHVHIPPLRERIDDLPELIELFLSHTAPVDRRKSISPEALTAMQAHVWPGNIRELRQVIERACVISRSDVIEPGDLDLPNVNAPDHEASTLAEVEKRHILKVLSLKGGNVSAAARELGIPRRTLYRRLEEYEYQRQED